MKLYREKIIGLVVIAIAFFSITSALNVKASFWKDVFSPEDSNKEKSIFDLSSLDSDSDGLSDQKEFELGTNPYGSDTDEDGYSDAEEIQASFDPLKQEGNNLIDKDGDGLTGEDEKKYETNADKADTDYDGYSDGFEILAGHDPLQADFSFLKPVIKEAEDSEAASEENCEGEDCNKIKNESSVDSTTPDSIEKLLNVQNFSEVNPESLSSIGLDSSRIDFDKEVNIAGVENDRIKVVDNTSKEFIQIYFNVLGIVLYSNSPIRTIEEAESYASSIDITNAGQIEEMKKVVSSIREEFEKTEVPNKAEFIEYHKKVIGASITLENLVKSLGGINSTDTNSFYSLMNLLPKFSGFNDLVFDNIYPEAKRLAAENGVELPKKEFLEQHQ
jgi:hypothetical protein